MSDTALRLADALGIVSVGGPLTVAMHEAAAELRRLHAENEALKAERERICKQIAMLHDSLSLASAAAIRSRSN